MARGRRLMSAFLSQVAGFVFLLPLLPVRYKVCRRVAAFLLSMSQVYAVVMHIYLMDRYWLHKTVESSQGLIMELLLYISASLTFPLMLHYIISWRFACSLFSCRGTGAVLPCHRNEHSPLLQHGTKVWLERLEQEAIAIVAEAATESDENARAASKGRIEIEVIANQHVSSDPVVTDDWFSCHKSSDHEHDLEVLGENSESVVTRMDHFQPVNFPCRGLNSNCEGQEIVELGVEAVSLEQSLSASGCADGRSTVAATTRQDKSHLPRTRLPGFTVQGHKTGSHSYTSVIGVNLHVPSDHAKVFLASLLGNLLVIAFIALDLADERVFDEKNIRRFIGLYKLSLTEVIFYWTYVAFVFWGMFSSVTTCTIFHAFCPEKRRAIDLVVSVLRRCGDRERARRRIDELIQFLHERQLMMRAWFIVHTFCFAVVLLVQLYFVLPIHHSKQLAISKQQNVWIMADQEMTEINSTSLPPNNQEQSGWWTKDILTVFSEAVSISILLFKFFYPLFQAASVTQHWIKAVRTLNQNDKLALCDKNDIIVHWENCHFAYSGMFKMSVTGGRVIAFGISALLLLMKAIKTYE